MKSCEFRCGGGGGGWGGGYLLVIRFCVRVRVCVCVWGGWEGLNNGVSLLSVYVCMYVCVCEVERGWRACNH